RGWVMVRALRLGAAEIATALEAGDFYASTGVRIREISNTTNKLTLQIEGEPSVTYITQFIGTRITFNESSQPVDTTNNRLTRSYSPDIGQVLAQAEGTSPAYEFRGDEIYVRAKVISSK